MKIPVSYELNGRRRCLLVEDGETIHLGRGEACQLRMDAEGVRDEEMAVQFVNGCQLVVVHPGDGSVPYAQPLPWKVKVGRHELELCRPFRMEQGKAGREVVFQGVGAGDLRMVLANDQPLLLGAGQTCDVVISDAGCPEMLLALWPAAGGKVFVQVLDDSAVVGWLGRAGEGEAELELPLSLSIGGRVILVRAGDAATSHGHAPTAKTAAPALAALPKMPGIQAKHLDYAPKIVSRQAKTAQESRLEAGPPVHTSEPAAPIPVVQAALYASSPVPLPNPSALVGRDEPALLPEPVIPAPAPYSPTVFLLFSWLLVALAFAVALLPGRGFLTPEQLVQLWYAAGGTLILTLLLGLGVLLK
ncbi:hypothetical protein [Prosthecobacter sp.]|uniref:hypothetical protein n=1 Tax=Prosthecobacter sp. TaxID=1965333 RepID=UPI003783BA42